MASESGSELGRCSWAILCNASPLNYVGGCTGICYIGGGVEFIFLGSCSCCNEELKGRDIIVKQSKSFI